MQFFYSHGFHSSKDSLAYQRICEGLHLKPLQLVYDNGGDFRTNLQSCKEQLMVYKPTMPFGLIGNSLGAFYLWQLMLYADTLNVPLPCVFIFFNPVFEPLGQLKKYIDKPQINSTTQQHFTLCDKHWESYAFALRLPIPNTISNINGVVCLSESDELIDGSISQAYWQHYAKIVHLQGGHIITDFAPLYECLCPLLHN